MRRTTKNLVGGHERIPRTGSFRNEGDLRPTLTRENFDKRACQNTSFSYTYRNLYCDSCTAPHPILGKNIKPVFVISDQNFPPAVPVQDGGRCLAIARIEDGSLSELADLFLRKVKTDWLPAETIVLLASASHLAKVGTVAYAEEYVKTKHKLESELPDGWIVLHAPVILLAGCVDPPLIRSLYNICQWLVQIEGKHDRLGDLGELHMMWMDLLTKTKTGGMQEPYTIRMQTPTTIDYPITQAVWTLEPARALPAHTIQISQPLEAKYL